VEPVGTLRKLPRLVAHPSCGRRNERRARGARTVSAKLDPRALVSRYRVEVDDCNGMLGDRRVPGKPARSCAAEHTAVGRKEDDRVGRPHARDGRRRRRACGRVRVRARELEHGPRSGGIVVCALVNAGVVTMRHHDNRLGRSSRRRGDDVRELDQAAARDVDCESLHARTKAVRPKLREQPVDRALGARASGRAIRMLLRQLCGERGGALAVECRGQLRLRDRRRPRDRERCDEQREGDE